MLTENLTTSVAAGRPTISVVIDEDEDTQEEIELQSGDRIHGVLMSNGSQTVERHSKESANFVCRFIIHTIFATSFRITTTLLADMCSFLVQGMFIFRSSVDLSLVNIRLYLKGWAPSTFFSFWV